MSREVTRTTVKPTRTEVPWAGGTATEEDHPAYATIGAYRVQAGPPGRALFGSDFRHQHYMVIRIGPASMRRDLNEDWVQGGGTPYVEVALSEAQWATFVSAPNVGHGTACTLEYFAPEQVQPPVVGEVPGIAPIDNRRVQFNAEVDERLQTAVRSLEAIRDAAPTKKLRMEAEQALRELTDGLPWVAKQFDEHAEKTIEKAKVEVAAYIENAIARAGIKALGGDPDAVPFRLGSGEEGPMTD